MTERVPPGDQGRTPNCVGPGTADAIRLLIDKHFGPGYWRGFQAYMVEPDKHGKEWRFGGTLGFGGKVHLNGGRLWVSCYPGDSDPLTDEEILRVNRELEGLLTPVLDEKRGGNRG